MKKTYLTIAITFLFQVLSGQINDYSWVSLQNNAASFDSIVDAYNNYLLETYPDSIPDNSLPAIKDYHRYVYFWQTRLGIVDGKPSYMPYTIASHDNLLDPICEGADSANWMEMGPVTYPTQWLGLVDQVLSDPNNPGSYLISADRGGIWKNQDTGHTWRNVTDDLRLPGLAATEMIRNPFDPNHILASTAYGVLNNGSYGLGIIQSFDNGDSWSVMESFPYESLPFVQRIIYDPNDTDSTDGLTLYVISDTIIYRSFNTGDNWGIMTGPGIVNNHTRFIDIEIDHKGDIYLTSLGKYGFFGQFFKFNGYEWVNMNLNGVFGEFQRARVSNPDSSKIFLLLDGRILPDSITRRRIYISSDYGNNWNLLQTFIGIEHGPGFKNEIEYSSISNLLYLGFVDMGIYDLDLDSINWIHNNISLHYDIRDFDFLGINQNGYEEILAANDGGLTLCRIDTQNIFDPYYLNNLNGNYLPIGDFTGLGVSLSGNEFLIGGAVHCNSFQFKNGAWQKFGGGDGGDCEVNWSNQDIFYFQNNANMYKFDSIEKIVYSNKDWFIGMEYELNPNDPYILYFGRGRKIDTTVIPDDTVASLFIYDERTDELARKKVPKLMKSVGAIGISFDSVIYVADFNADGPNTLGRLIKSNNNGDTWSDLSSGNVYEKIGSSWVFFNNLSSVMAWKTVGDIICHPSNENELWISITGVWTDTTGQPEGGRFRILHSVDAGTNWYDYSENLTAFPIGVLEFQPGSHNNIFAGTDVGVFHRDTTMNQWECFSNGLPVCVITDLDYELCGNLYASTYGRGIYKTSLPVSYNGSLTLAKNENILWDTPKILTQNIIIPDSTTLTITADMKIFEDVKIIVKQGGRLVIEDCKLTKGCDGLWGGIEVWGNPDTTQIYSGVQGQVEFFDATIENAKLAVLAGKNDEDGYYVRGFEGGIIKAKNSHFINNLWAVAIGPYKNIHPVTSNEINNLSRFDLCEFIINDDFPGSPYFQRHVFLSGISGIKFTGCVFTNNLDNDEYAATERGTGIYSVGSMFYVSDTCLDTVSPCPQPIPSEFNYFSYGIKAFGIFPQNTCTIESSKFMYNWLAGIYLSGIDHTAINMNEFFIHSKEGDTALQFPCGLYLNNCTGYQVEENEFRSGYIGGNDVSIGITINNSGQENNIIYNNFFRNLFVGILAQNENRSEDGLTGLQLICNDFKPGTCEYDIAITANEHKEIFGIRYHQGSNGELPTSPANNIFSYTHQNSTSDYHINEECNRIIYWHLKDTTTAKTKPKQHSIPEVSPQFNPANNNNYDKENCCPSSFIDGGGEIEDERAKMENAEMKIDSTRNLLDILVDGGDTDALDTEVQTSFPDEAVEVRNQLIAESPFLSDTVLVSAVNKENVLTPAMVTEILMANPQSAKSDTVQQVLDNRIIPLSEEQRTDIDQGWFEVGSKESLEAGLAHYMAERQKALNNLIRYFRSDSLFIASNDSIINVLNNENSLEARYALAFEYFAKDDTANTMIVLNSVPSDFILSSGQNAQHLQYENFFSLLLQLNGQGNNIFDIDSTDIAMLYNILNNSNGRFQARIRNILINLDTLVYYEPYILPGQSLKQERIKRKPVRKTYEVNSFKVYPNPAGNYIILEYTIKDENPEGVVQLIDITGKIVKSIRLEKNRDYMVFPLNGLPGGIYICKFVIENKIIETHKLVIAH